MHFLSPSPKSKKIYREKKSLYFRKWKFLALILKKVLIFPEMKPYSFRSQPSKFFAKKNFLHFFVKKPALKRFFIYFLKKPLVFSKRKPRKKILTFQETRIPKKASYISGNGTVQSTVRIVLILQETETPKNLLIFSPKKTYYISGNGNREKKFYISGTGIFGAQKMKIIHS